MNRQHAYHILETALLCGVESFCICPGARNAPLVSALAKASEVYGDRIACYYWFEERSAGFFALGKSRAASKPVAIITTSGTAVAELLPAVMEAHYSGVPLLMITADRPRRYRFTGAPQCAEQVGIFSHYTQFTEDLAAGQTSQLHTWKRTGPAHLNVCFDEPLRISTEVPLQFPLPAANKTGLIDFSPSWQQAASVDAAKVHSLQAFLENAQNLLVVAGALHQEEKESVCEFLVELNAPVYLESLSGLREEKRLSPLKITQPGNLLENAKLAGYPISDVLRIGGIPTFRAWRDLSESQSISTCSLSPLPFAGVCDGTLIQAPINPFLKIFPKPVKRDLSNAYDWLLQDKLDEKLFQTQLKDQPRSETAMIYALSKIIPEGSLVYLGNSLPIREWDLAATKEERGCTFYANRGVNGIDGQLSTFLGLCQPGRENWAILGDLTTLYDLAAPWILRQLANISITIVVINNGGGQIFSQMFPEKAFLHSHTLSFKPLAELWGMNYLKWESIPSRSAFNALDRKTTLIELIPHS